MNPEQYRIVYKVLAEGLKCTTLIEVAATDTVADLVIEQAVDAALAAFERTTTEDDTDTPGNTARSREQSRSQRKRDGRER